MAGHEGAFPDPGRLSILVLDDDPVRHVLFADRLRGHDVRHTDSPLVAAELVGPGSLEWWDYVYLDYDLDWFEGGTEVKGLVVAQSLCGLWPILQGVGQVVLHTWNDEGRQLMLAELDRYGVPVSVEVFNGGQCYSATLDRVLEMEQVLAASRRGAPRGR